MLSEVEDGSSRSGDRHHCLNSEVHLLRTSRFAVMAVNKSTGNFGAVGLRHHFLARQCTPADDYLEYRPDSGPALLFSEVFLIYIDVLPITVLLHSSVCNQFVTLLPNRK